MIRDIVHVEHLHDTELLLTFDDGTRRAIDIAEVVTFDGVFQGLTDPAYFRRVRVEPELGTIVWPNGADLCPDVLYTRGRPLVTREPEVLERSRAQAQPGGPD